MCVNRRDVCKFLRVKSVKLAKKLSNIYIDCGGGGGEVFAAP